jgi:hypothetical protein
MQNGTVASQEGHSPVPHVRLQRHVVAQRHQCLLGQVDSSSGLMLVTLCSRLRVIALCVLQAGQHVIDRPAAGRLHGWGDRCSCLRKDAEKQIHRATQSARQSIVCRMTPADNMQRIRSHHTYGFAECARLSAYWRCDMRACQFGQMTAGQQSSVACLRAPY